MVETTTINTAILLLALVSTVALLLGVTWVQAALLPVMMVLTMWFLAREALTFDADAGTVTFHFFGR